MPNINDIMNSHTMSQQLESFKTSTLMGSAQKCRRRVFKAVMNSQHFRIPKYDLPIRIRPWFVVLTCLIMTLLAFLGFTNFHKSLPLNDKLLHFLCFSIATGVFYFILDVEEDARRVWFWRHAGLIFTGIICFFCGGILSELVQSALPYKEFQIGDVVANLLGSSLGLLIAYHLDRYYRHRREIARLYRPLDSEYLSDNEQADILDGTQLLPLLDNQADAGRKGRSNQSRRLADVWDEGEELFNQPDSDDEDPFMVNISKQPKLT